MQPKFGLAARVVILLIVLLLLLAYCGSRSNQTTTFIPEGNQVRSQTDIVNLNGEIPIGTEMWLVDIWGPEDATFAIFQEVNSGRQYRTQCTKPKEGRPAKGFDQIHYFLSGSDPTLLVPPSGVTGLQDFRILEEITPVSVVTNTPFPTITNIPSSSDATSYVVNPGTPVSPGGNTFTIPYGTCWNIILLVLGAIVLFVIVRVIQTRRSGG